MSRVATKGDKLKEVFKSNTERSRVKSVSYQKKMEKQKDSTPYADQFAVHVSEIQDICYRVGYVVYVVDLLTPGTKMWARLVKFSYKNRRQTIKIIACPECKSKMLWDDSWGAFICTSHGKKAIYELVRPGFNKE
jgi:hypothetical protein